jgi:hypothetical protein
VEDTTDAAAAAPAIILDGDAGVDYEEVPGDDRAGGRRRLRFSPIIMPSALYSSSRGFGLGGGVQITGLTAPDAALRLEARVAERLQGIRASYYTGDPMARPVYGRLGMAATTTSRYPFYGVGPRSRRESKLYLDHLSAEVEANVGWYPFRHTGLLLQPVARFRFDRSRGYEAARDSALFYLDPASRAHIDSLQGTDRYGVAVGLEALSDTRDSEASPTRGYFVQGGATRFFATDGSGLGFQRFEVNAYGFTPALLHLRFLPERGALFVRASGVVTRPDAGDDLPFFYQPTLDHEQIAGYPQSRFVGRDAVSLGLGARGTIFQAIGAILVEGMGMAMVGGAYNDVFEEFTPRVTLDPEPDLTGERIPLRPSVAFGVNFIYIDRDRPLLGALVGFGPEGFVLASFRLIYDLRTYRPQAR